MCNEIWLLLCIVFFKQKTAFEMRISDWSSDVCSSDLSPPTYLAHFGYSHSGLERPFMPVASAMTSLSAGSIPCSAQSSIALHGSHRTLKVELVVWAYPGTS